MNTAAREQKKNVPNKRLAAILTKMIEEFALMETANDEENDQLQKDALATFNETFTEVNLPEVKVSEIILPTLGPLDDESELEPHNRCWMIA